jgi:hypothetical protein
VCNPEFTQSWEKKKKKENTSIAFLHLNAKTHRQILANFPVLYKKKNATCARYKIFFLQSEIIQCNPSYY